MATLSFEQARECVIREVANAQPAPTTEQVSLLESDGRVLAERIVADRDYPTLARSVRDGFAVRAADLPGELRVIGEVRAGERFSGEVRTGEAVEIMTGAPMPGGADSVVMIEHVTVSAGRVDVPRTLRPGENVSPQGSEAHQGDVLLEPGRRLGFAQIALAATVGCARLHVFRKPQVAIIATGDEIVDVGDTPLDHQIRNSNTQSLAVQVARAGGCPRILPVARDVYGVTRELVEQALQHDLVLLSGGVSAGKYDIVERVLADVGARFFFDRVLIQPGQPLVFGQARGKFFFGLPGNPASTMVTFEIFARAALQILRGECQPALELLWTRLAEDLRQKTGLTRFLPARVSADGSEVTPVKWQGSGDVSAQARANAYLVTDPDRESWAKGEWIRVLLK